MERTGAADVTPEMIAEGRGLGLIIRIVYGSRNFGKGMPPMRTPKAREKMKRHVKRPAFVKPESVFTVPLNHIGNRP